MTDIKVDPHALRGVAHAVAGSVPAFEAVEKEMGAVGKKLHTALGQRQHTAGSSTFPDRARHLAYVTGQLCDSYRDAFGVFAEATAALANNATSAADTFEYQDTQAADSLGRPGGGDRPAAAGGAR